LERADASLLPPRPPLPFWKRTQGQVRALVNRTTWKGELFMGFANAVLILDLCKTLLSTVPQFQAATRLAFHQVGMFASVVFALEYGLRIWARPEGVLDANRLIDLVLWLPLLTFEVYYKSQGRAVDMKHQGLERHMELLMLCRVIRILDFPIFRREVVVIFRALRGSIPLLVVPVFLAVQVWVTVATLFFAFEKIFKGPAKDEMESVPSAIYWTSFFLIGEWALADFSRQSDWLCIFCCIFGMMMFAIPMGVITEAVQTQLFSELVESTGLHELHEINLQAKEEDKASEASPGKKLEEGEEAGKALPHRSRKASVQQNPALRRLRLAAAAMDSMTRPKPH